MTDTERLAQFLQQKDAREFGIVVDGVAHPRWDEADPLARQRYVEDASLILRAVAVLGYSKPATS